MKMIVIAVLMVMTMASAVNAFADWKVKDLPGVVINDPAPCPFNNSNF